MTETTGRPLHHINFVVDDLEAATERFTHVLGTVPRDIEYLPKRQVALRRFWLGNVWFILVAPTADESPAAAWLKQHGPGLFLMSFEVEALDQALQQLSEAGVSADGRVRRGLDDWQVVDLDRDQLFGIPVQLTQVTQQEQGSA
ncbi:MAG: VOC family protein [Pseudomonadota bacterium]